MKIVNIVGVSVLVVLVAIHQSSSQSACGKDPVTLLVTILNALCPQLYYYPTLTYIPRDYFQCYSKIIPADLQDAAFKCQVKGFGAKLDSGSNIMNGICTPLQRDPTGATFMKKAMTNSDCIEVAYKAKYGGEYLKHATEDTMKILECQAKNLWVC